MEKLLSGISRLPRGYFDARLSILSKRIIDYWKVSRANPNIPYVEAPNDPKPCSKTEEVDIWKSAYTVGPNIFLKKMPCILEDEEIKIFFKYQSLKEVDPVFWVSVLQLGALTSWFAQISDEIETEQDSSSDEDEKLSNLFNRDGMCHDPDSPFFWTQMEDTNRRVKLIGSFGNFSMRPYKSSVGKEEAKYGFMVRYNISGGDNDSLPNNVVIPYAEAENLFMTIGWMQKDIFNGLDVLDCVCTCYD